MRCSKVVIALSVILLSLCGSAYADGRVLVTIRKDLSTASDSSSGRTLHPIRMSSAVLNARQFIVNTPDGPLVAQRNGFRAKQNRVRVGDRSQTISTTLGKTVFSTKEHTAEYVLSVDQTSGGKVVHGIFSGLDDRAYVLRRIRGRMRLEVVKKSELPSCAGVRTNGTKGHKHTTSVENAGDVRVADATVVDVAVFYSAEAFAAAGGTEATMVAEANSAVALGNQAYAQSGVDLTLNLVHVSQSGAENGASFETILDRLINPNDGIYDDIHATRQAVNADVVIYMISNQSFCGLAPLLVSLTDTSFARLALGAVSRVCIPNFSFVHEISHMMGAHHDIANAGDDVVYPYAYGHRFRGISNQQFRTAMAYAPGTRINYFSNPSLTFDGRPLGTSLANNARVLTNTKAFVSTFSELIDPTPTPEPTATSTSTPTPVPGEPTPTATATPGASGGSGSIPPIGPLAFSQVKAKLGSKVCKVTATITGSGDSADGAIAQLLISKKNKVLASKEVTAGQISFSIPRGKVVGKKLQIFLTTNVSSKTFKCR